MSAPTTTRPERGQELDLRVDTLAYGGNGVARLEGYVVFVNGAVPATGCARSSPSASAATRRPGRSRSSSRRPSASSRSRPAIPGRPWQVLPYERQLEVKAEQVGDALRRIGRLEGFEQEPIVPAEEGWRYRNKVEYSFGTGDGRCPRVRLPQAGLVGGDRPRRGRPARVRGGQRLRRRVVGWARDRGLGAYDRRSQEGFLRNLVIREGRRTGDLQLRLVTSEQLPEAFDETRSRRPCPAPASSGRGSSAWARRPPAARPTTSPARRSCARSSPASSTGSRPRRSSRPTR
jgi:23S rRNA (uracil1939-C5)-methyltransferase